MLSYPLQFCIDPARTFQKKLLNLFSNRSYASLQLVEALAHASKPTTIVELSQETPFQRSYSVINKVLDAFGAESLVTKTVNVGESVKTVQSSDPVAFSKITKPFSGFFLKCFHKKQIANFVYSPWTLHLPLEFMHIPSMIVVMCTKRIKSAYQ